MSVIGIDLGTTFSAMAYLDAQGNPVTIANAEGEMTTPSIVLFEKSGEVVVGREAKRAALSEPAHVAVCVKRYVGDEFYPKLINNKRLTPTAISALILKKLRQDAEKRIGRIDGAVITVPAYFDEGRRQVTAAAGRLAGLKVLDIINEPTSAALAYAYKSFTGATATSTTQVEKAINASPPSVMMIYDLGGGTFDVTLIRTQGKNLNVLATTGDVRLGGCDWDECLFNYMAEQFIRMHNEDPRDDPVSLQNLMLAAEETKHILSARKHARYLVNHQGKSFTGEIAREQFEKMTEALLYRTESRLGRVIRQANLTWDKVDRVLAVGGSTRMPQVPAMLERFTGKAPDCSLSPDQAVAHGAAIHAAIGVVHDHKPPKAARTSTKDDAVALIEDSADAKVSTPGMLSYFKGKVADLLSSIRTTNVNAHTLGVVVTLGDKSERVVALIPHDTQLPVSVTKRFGTVKVNQSSVTVRVVEGESDKPEDCLQVGTCQVRKLPPRLPKGSPIDVTFAYDNSGRLHVTAMTMASRDWASVTIQRKSGLAQEKMLDDADRETVAAPVV
jgi:molecular chaperone DnaK